MDRASTAEVRQRINVKFRELFYCNDGMHQPYVCVICDEFIGPDKLECISLKTLNEKGSILKQGDWNHTSVTLAGCYKIKSAWNIIHGGTGTDDDTSMRRSDDDNDACDDYGESYDCSIVREKPEDDEESDGESSLGQSHSDDEETNSDSGEEDSDDEISLGKSDDDADDKDGESNLEDDQDIDGDSSLGQSSSDEEESNDDSGEEDSQDKSIMGENPSNCDSGKEDSDDEISLGRSDDDADDADGESNLEDDQEIDGDSSLGHSHSNDEDSNADSGEEDSDDESIMGGSDEVQSRDDSGMQHRVDEDDGENDEDDGEHSTAWMENLLLSPRAIFIRHNDKRRVDGFSCCGSCKHAIVHGQMPKFAIANNYCFGTPPGCLLALTEVELAMLTPVKTYGYCFSYTGGRQKQLKGSLAYYKVNIASVARAAMHFDVLGLHNNIVILLYGKMTTSQIQKVRERSKIRTDYILHALQWLVTHNEEWVKAGINLEDIRNKLINPLVVNNSVAVEGDENESALESTESFNVFFPDGTMSCAMGGQDNLEAFKDLVKAASMGGFDIAIRSDLMKEAVGDFRDNNLVNSCLLQFPYGRGGMQELRLKRSGSFTTRTDIQEYVDHLCRLSQPQFHQELFSLVLYNLSMKQAMVRTASWRVRNKCDAQTLAKELDMDDLAIAISTRQHNGRKRKYGTNADILLNGVDAVARYVPHTNEAAKQARGNGDCIQHHFGTPSLFLTVTPDDDNSFLVQVLSQQLVDGGTPVALETDEELARKAKKRTVLRIKYPGICALFFEYILEIILEEVVGWDLKRGKAKEDQPGLFGKPQAFTATVEEQGRRTLHVHVQIWLEDFNKWRESLHSRSRITRRKAERNIIKFVDSISNCRMFHGENIRGMERKLKKAFPHQCSVASTRNRHDPSVVDDQGLRNLRQRQGAFLTGIMLAYCPHCCQTWSGDELVESFLMNGIKVPGLTKFPDGEVRRLKAMAVAYQKNEECEKAISSWIIDAAYNHHSHTKSCFEKSGRVCEPGTAVECRYRYPQRRKRRTTIENASQSSVRWFKWDGTEHHRFIKEVCMRRGIYDAFQNICCPAISYSKLTCNTNIAAVMLGPIGQYVFKYSLKGTQKEDTEEYERVKQAMQKVLSNLRNYNSDRSEAIKRLLAASFAHQKTNVVGAAMASYLTRKKSRFVFSHKTVWCPLRDMKALLHGGTVTASVMEHNKIPFFQCAAMHYLCRPVELDEISAFEFYSQYEVVRMTSRNRDDLMEFSKECEFHHPSYCDKKGTFLQGVRSRAVPNLVKIYQYDFPDTALFKGSLLDDNIDVSTDMEEYSELVLLLFFPYRCLSEIVHDGLFTCQLRNAVKDGIVGNQAFVFLQNIQDAKSNSYRVTGLQDDLQRRTVLINQCHGNSLEESGKDHPTEELEGDTLDEFLACLHEEVNADNAVDDDSQEIGKLPCSLSLDSIRRKGREKCGYSCLAGMKLDGMENDDPFMELEEPETQLFDTMENQTDQDAMPESTTTSKHDIVTVLVNKRSRKSRTFEEITHSQEIVRVLDANGSVASIVDWARKARLDRGQRRAFEIIVSTFLLTFFLDAEENNNIMKGGRHVFVREKKRLQNLAEVRKRGSDQLLCLLHGPGGSGKTTVIDLVMKYAEEYCSYLEGFRFTSRTILVTAMTGVAATILLGETTHSAVYLNQKRPIEAEQVELWSSTRLLIIDEVSFACKEDFTELHKKIRRLKQQLHLRYGGLSIIFSGDLRQLEPVGAGKKPVYEEDCPEFRDWVNCFIELNGMHRFKQDPEWGFILLRFRDGTVTLEDIDKVNERVVNSETELPENIKYATFFNRDRDSINTALFVERCKVIFENKGSVSDSLMIFSDDLLVQSSDKSYVPFRSCASFWAGCSEDDVKLPQGSGRMDPLLKIYKGCRVMLPANKNVKEGQANGTQATVEKVMLKTGEHPQHVFIDGNVPVPAVFARQVSYLLLKHSNERIQPPAFHVRPKRHTLKANILKPHVLQTKEEERESIKMKAFQLPIIVNNASTGHKLQGIGVDHLFVHNWSYVTNWVYVMLSRVKTRGGLFCRKPISRDLKKYAVPEALKRMLRAFSCRQPTYWDESEYNELFGTEV